MFKKEPYNFDELDHFCLGEQVNVRKKLGLIEIHVDEMDGHFVPNISNVLVAGSAFFSEREGVTVAMDRLRASVDHEIYSQRD